MASSLEGAISTLAVAEAEAELPRASQRLDGKTDDMPVQPHSGRLHGGGGVCPHAPVRAFFAPVESAVGATAAVLQEEAMAGATTILVTAATAGTSDLELTAKSNSTTAGSQSTALAEAAAAAAAAEG